MKHVVINPEFKKFDYRVVKNRYPNGQAYYSIHECWYDDKEPVAITARALKPKGNTFEELQKDMILFEGAFKKPTIDFSFFLSAEEIQEVYGGGFA